MQSLTNRKRTYIPGTWYTSAPAYLPDPLSDFPRVWFRDYESTGAVVISCPVVRRANNQLHNATKTVQAMEVVKSNHIDAKSHTHFC